MKIEPLEHEWTSPEMRAMFDKLAELRDDVWKQCQIELGEDVPAVATATELSARNRYERDPRRRAEIIEAYRQAAEPYVRKMSDLMARYTVPRMLIKKTDD